ncbi:MAG TPA: LytTR family transcriptional regulator, partial [Phenylobacterium sp.]|nr:LytTR family transcriptional regulator [Phenylobacterium sp.]
MRPTLSSPLTLGPRLAADAALLLALGLFMGAVGPFGTDILPAAERYLYWGLCIVGGGAIGVAIDESLGRRATAIWRRVGLTSLLMTPLVSAYVMLVRWTMYGTPAPHRPGLVELLWQVLVVSVLVMTVRAL